MQDHDQRFKNLIREFFAEFLELFFADWAARLDCAKVEWLDKEVFPDPPEGMRSILDLVGKLPAREPTPGADAEKPETWLALVHMKSNRPIRLPRYGHACSSIMFICACGIGCRCCRSGCISRSG